MIGLAVAFEIVDRHIAVNSEAAVPAVDEHDLELYGDDIEIDDLTAGADQLILISVVPLRREVPRDLRQLFLAQRVDKAVVIEHNDDHTDPVGAYHHGELQPDGARRVDKYLICLPVRDHHLRVKAVLLRFFVIDKIGEIHKGVIEGVITAVFEDHQLFEL